MEEEKLKTQLNGFRDSIEVAKNELRQLRSEKAQAAQTTLAQLNSAIPGLEARVKELQATLSDLEKKVAVKDAEYKRQNDDLSTRYLDMETRLKSRYAAAQMDLSALLEANRKLAEDYSKKEKEVFAREVAVEKYVEKLSRLESSLVERQQALNDKESVMKDAEVNLNAERERVNSLFAKKTVEFADKEAYLNRRIKECTDRELRASEIIDRVKEINAKVDQSQKILDENKKTESTISALGVKLTSIQKSLESKEKEQAQYDEKINIYKTELADLTQKLSEKRTEMATLAKKTLADYEAKIPKLELDILVNKNKLDSINDAIAQKNEELRKEQGSLSLRYSKLENDLKIAYEAKEQKLLEAKNRLEDMHKKKQKEFDDQDKDLRERERAVNESWSSTIDLKNKNKFEEDKLKKERADLNKEIALFDRNIEDQRAVLESLKNGVKEKAKELDDKLKAFGDKDIRVEAVLKRISEVEEKEKSLLGLRNSLDKRNSELDEFQVKLIAEKKKIDLRLQEVEKAEIRNKNRERNIRLAEEKIVKG